MTRIAVDRAGGRVTCRLEAGSLSPRLLRADGDRATVALVATGALLLGGDHVAVDVEVGTGTSLEIVETAGTVAYDGNGCGATWSVRARVGAGASLVWEGLPFVVAGGADVRRTTHLDLSAGSRVLLREVLVLGRAGEEGGSLRAFTRAAAGGADLFVEELDLAPAARRAPGILGGARVLDSVLALGWRPGPAAGPVARGTRFDLAGPGAVVRLLGTQAHRASVDGWWSSWRGELTGPVPPGPEAGRTAPAPAPHSARHLVG